MKNLLLLAGLLLGFTAQASNSTKICVTVGYKGDLENLIEKKKSMSYSYPLNTTDLINIENHYGDVKVKFWNKNEVKVYITVTANAPSEEKVDAFLGIVDIQTRKSNGDVHFVTRLNCLESTFKNNVNRSKLEEDKNFLKVDYQVYIPKGHNLTVNNSHGDVYIPEYTAELHIKQAYGNLFADHISNNNSIIDVNFGKAFIKSMTGGQLKSSQTSLLIDKIQDIEMTNNCGSLKVLEANNSIIYATYTKGYIGKVNQSCKFNVNYSKEFRLGEILPDVKKLEISSSHTNLKLPICMKSKYELTTSNSNTEMVMPVKTNEQFINTATKNQKHYTIGDPEANKTTKVLLTTKYGRVELK